MNKNQVAARSIVSVCVILSVLFAAVLATRGQTERPMAPNFSLTDISGKPLNLTDYRGKVVLLNFWATWCAPCRIETPQFVDLVNRYGKQDLAVVGLSLDDDVEPVQEFARQYKVNYQLALGNEKVAESYGGVFSLPITFLIGSDGRVYAKHLGAVDLGALEAELRQLLSKTANAEVMDFKSADEQRVGTTIEPENAEEIASEVPGVNLETLTAAQRQAFKTRLEALHCTCKCQMTVLKCRMDDSQCGFSLRMARTRLAEFAGSHP